MTNKDFSDAARKMTPAERAFAELEGLVNFLGGQGLHSNLMALAKRGHEIIDQCIDRPVEEKEALKALLVLQFGSPFIFDDTTRFATEYGPETAAMVDDFVCARETQNSIQMSLVLAVSMIESMNNELRQIAVGDQAKIKEFLSGDLADLERGMAEVLELCPQANAPKLAILTSGVVNEALSMARKLVGGQPGPTSPSPG